MKKEVWRGQNSVRFIYFRYKDSPYFSWLILSIIFLVCFILIFQVIIPHAQSLFFIREEAEETRQKIDIIGKNKVFMSALNKSVVEGNRKLAIRALPVDKDFGGIINAVVIAAVKSGVSIDDFSFNLGLVSSPSAETKNSRASDPTTKLSLSLSGNINKLKSFITEISEKLPISEIESVEASNGGTYLSLSFHSKPYIAPRVSEDEPVRSLSAENSSLFNKLSQWDAASYDTQETQAPSASVPLF